MHNEYEAPTVRELGAVAGFTQGQSTGERLDSDFPAGTPFADLTFS